MVLLLYAINVVSKFSSGLTDALAYVQFFFFFFLYSVEKLVVYAERGLWLQSAFKSTEWLLPPDNWWRLQPLNGYWHQIDGNKATNWLLTPTVYMNRKEDLLVIFHLSAGCDRQDLESTHRSRDALVYVCTRKAYQTSTRHDLPRAISYDPR